MPVVVSISPKPLLHLGMDESQISANLSDASCFNGMWLDLHIPLLYVQTRLCCIYSCKSCL